MTKLLNGKCIALSPLRGCVVCNSIPTAYAVAVFFRRFAAWGTRTIGPVFRAILVDPGVEEALALGELLSGIDALYLKNSRSNGRISMDHNTDGFRRNLLFSGVGWLDRPQEFLLGDDVAVIDQDDLVVQQIGDGLLVTQLVSLVPRLFKGDNFCLDGAVRILRQHVSAQDGEQ